ncbi:MAG: hypothetical protein ACKVQS_12820 [Fimbriimonadaceae bacterium]
MAARKRQEAAEEAAMKKPAAKKPVAEPAVQPESVVVPADMLSQLMAQIQTLTLEVGELRSKVAEPVLEAAEKTVCPVGVQSVEDVSDLGEVTQEEIELAEANPDLMPDDFYTQEMPDEPVDRDKTPFDSVAFESRNPGLLGEIALFNADIDDIHPELTQEEIDIAAATPDEMPADFFAGDDEEVAVENPEIDSVAFEELSPGLLAEIEAYNLENPGADSHAITAEEASALLAGFDQAMAESDREAEASVDIAEATPDSDSPVSADDIAALFASAETPPTMNSAIDLTDDDISKAIEEGAQATEESTDLESESDEYLEDLSEIDLVALIRQSIEVQAESLDEKAAEELAQAEAMAAIAEAQDASGSSVMSAAEIAALLATPDEEGDVVPGQSSAMSDDELKALLLQVESGELTEPVPTADDVAEFSFVQEQSEPIVSAVQKPVISPKVPTGEAELGAIKAVPAHLAVRALALPVRFEEGKILCRVAEPIDRAALDQLSKTIGFGIIIEAAPIDEVVAGIRVAYAEFQDYNARAAVISGAQNRAGLVEKISNMWKKSA